MSTAHLIYIQNPETLLPGCATPTPNQLITIEWCGKTYSMMLRDFCATATALSSPPRVPSERAVAQELAFMWLEGDPDTAPPNFEAAVGQAEAFIHVYTEAVRRAADR